VEQKNVLVIEDDEIRTARLASVLKDEGYTVRSSSGGASVPASTLKLSPADTIDLVLTSHERAVKENAALKRTLTTIEDTLASMHIVQKNYLQLLETNIDAIFVVDDAQMIRYANSAANRLFPHPDPLPAHRKFPYDLDKLGEEELEIKDKSGETLYIDARKMKTDWNGQVMNLVVLRDVTESIRLKKELQQLSLTDDLTKVYNRRGFMIFASRAVHQAKRLRQRLFVLFADLDGLKNINDYHGHQVGDTYLKMASEVLTSSFREVDTIARMGGDEFAVMGMITEACIPDSLVERLHHNIDRYNEKNAPVFGLAMSIGIAVYDPVAPEPIERVIERADDAMYRQKKSKKVNGAITPEGVPRWKTQE